LHENVQKGESLLFYFNLTVKAVLHTSGLLDAYESNRIVSSSYL